MQENLAKAKGLVSKDQLATDVNFEFHTLLAKASKNAVFVILEKAINTIHHDFRSRRSPDLVATQKAIQAHEKILDALIHEEREKAINLLEQHILDIQNSY